MKYLLQRPHPDELLSSVWIRTRRRAGVGIGLVARYLTGSKFSPGFLSASHVVSLGDILEVSPLELLWKHTDFPYASAFFEQDIFKASLSAALSTGHGAIGSSATIQSVSDHIRLRRFCRSCAQSDERNFGESYWHREHQLPGVLFCSEHSEVLRESEIPVNQVRPWPDFLPNELKSHRLLTSISIPFDVKLAERSLELLHRAEVTSMPRSKSWYREQLLEKGLLSVHHPVDQKRLAQWARTCLKGHAKHLGLSVKDLSFQWLALMVRPRSGIPFIPLKHLIFETLLTTTGHVDVPLVDYVSPGMPARSSEALDRKFAAALKAVIRMHERTGGSLRISDALTAAGCWGTFRHDRIHFPRVQALVTELRKSQVSARRIKGKTEP